MLKTMRQGSAFFIKGVMIFVVVTFIGTIFVVWGVKSTPGELGRRGVIGLASELVKYDRQIETAVQYLLGTTIVVRDATVGPLFGTRPVSGS